MWQIEVHRGDAAAFHQLAMPETIVPSVWWFEVESSAVVLGSGQPIDHIDADACARLGVDVVRRRSGGGGVLLQPGDALWVDVLIPRTDPRWADDIGRSAWWLGECWQAALHTLGVEGTEVHRGPMVRTPWSAHVCFAGIGGGEVVRDGHKVVGISQRRTRAGARFQCALYRHWRADAHAALFSPPGPTAEDLEGLVVTIDAGSADVMAALTAALAPR